MEQSKAISKQKEAGRQLEEASRLSDAAAIYQKLFDSDPTDQQVISRLLVLYRKLKEYRKELSVLNSAIAASQSHQKAVRDKWIASHPKAATAGKSMLRQLEKGGDVMMGLGTDPAVERWMKRKELVTSRITGKKVKRPAKSGKSKKAAVVQKKSEPVKLRHTESKARQRQREKAAADKKKAVREHAAAAARERANSVARDKKEKQERKAAEVERKKAEAQKHPSLFVVILRYLVSMEKIDAAMKQHMAYLDKHYKNGKFLVSGRQVPRNGGIILARGKDRNALEKTIKQDPLVKRKLASADIIEFTASQVGKGLEGWLKV